MRGTRRERFNALRDEVAEQLKDLEELRSTTSLSDKSTHSVRVRSACQRKIKVINRSMKLLRDLRKLIGTDQMTIEEACAIQSELAHSFHNACHNAIAIVDEWHAYCNSMACILQFYDQYAYCNSMISIYAIL